MGCGREGEDHGNVETHGNGLKGLGEALLMIDSSREGKA